MTIGDYVTEYSVRNKANENIPVYSVTNSQGFCKEYFNKEVASKDKSTYKIVPRGYFAYNPSRINVGSVDWQRNEERVIVSPLYNVFSVSDELDKQYLFYFLKSDIGRQMIKAKAFGSVRDNLKLDMLKEMTIPKRTIKEQKKCATVLDKLKEIISLHTERIGKYDDFIKARFVEMFTDKGFPKTTIGSLVANKVPTAKKSFAPSDTIKYIDISSIDNKRNIMTGYTEYVLEDAPSRAQQHIQKNDIVVSTVRPNLKNVAITGYNDKNLVASSGFCVLRVEKCLPSYLMAIVCSDDFTDAMTKVVTGANYPAIKDSDVKNYVIPLPPIDLQNEFAKFVEETDKSKVAIQKIHKKGYNCL